MSDKYAHSLSVEPPPPLPTRDDYRALGGRVRELAARTRLPHARRELLRLAGSYERRGDHLNRA